MISRRLFLSVAGCMALPRIAGAQPIKTMPRIACIGPPIAAYSGGRDHRVIDRGTLSSGSALGVPLCRRPRSGWREVEVNLDWTLFRLCNRRLYTGALGIWYVFGLFCHCERDWRHVGDLASLS